MYVYVYIYIIHINIYIYISYADYIMNTERVEYQTKQTKLALNTLGTSLHYAHRNAA